MNNKKFERSYGYHFKNIDNSNYVVTQKGENIIANSRDGKESHVLAKNRDLIEKIENLKEGEFK